MDNLDAKSLTGQWKPVGWWNDVHGDCKSSTGGKWTMRTMTTSNGTFKVQIQKNGNTVYDVEYDSEPSWETVVTDAKAKHGS